MSMRRSILLFSITIYCKLDMQGHEHFCRSTLQRIAGDNAAQSCESLLDKHCSSTSPFLQILYVLLLAGGYFLYCRDIFCFLPQPFAPLWHQ